MTIQHALDFIKQGQTDEALRRRLVKTQGKAALKAALDGENLYFTQAEFEEAYSLSLFKCQDEGDAHALMAFRMWWNLLARAPEQETDQPPAP
jgi:hypothetical protein